MNTYNITTKVGSIYYIDLGPEVNYCIENARPYVIIERNKAAISVYAFAEDNYRNPIDDSEIPIPKGTGNLNKDLRLKMGQIITIDRNRVISYIGDLPKEYLIKIKKYIENRGIIKKISNIITQRKK